jgi:hypothetical protein
VDAGKIRLNLYLPGGFQYNTVFQTHNLVSVSGFRPKITVLEPLKKLMEGLLEAVINSIKRSKKFPIQYHTSKILKYH